MKYLLVLVLLITACGSQPQPPAPTSVTTSGGIRVTSLQSLSLGHLAQIDAQYEELLRIASATYQVLPAQKEIQIFIVARDMRCRQISFVITEDVARGTNYDGTEFDLDGEQNGRIEMCVAGRYHSGNGSIEVTADGILQTDIVRYELEHWLLYRVDRERYWKTLIHTADNPHPILGNGGIEKASDYGPLPEGSAGSDAGDAYVGLYGNVQ